MPSSTSTSHLGRRARALLSLALLASLSGCATYRNVAHYPTPGQPVTAGTTATDLSKMSELPVGAYYDQPHRIVVSGHQKGLGVGMLFGVVGVLAADAANKSSAEKRFGDDSAQLGVDLVSLTRELLAERLPLTGSPAVTVADAASPQLEVTPFAVFTVDKTGEARLYALLKARLPGAKPGDAPRWSGRYFARAPGLHLLDGEDGWRQGERFPAAIRTAFTRAIDALFDDVNGRSKDLRQVKAKGRFAFLNIDLEVPVIVLAEDENMVRGRVMLGDAAVMSGTHVLDRSEFTWKDASFKDPR